MSNLRTNLFQGDLYIESSLDPTIYGSGNLNIDGDLTIAGTFSSVGSSTFNTLIINGTTSGTISIKPQAVAGTYNFNLPITSGTNGQVLTSAGGGASAMTWTTPTTGTVTSIALSVPTFLSVAGSPITSSGTLAVTLSGTALPILNGGTGSTTATGTGSVVLQTSPTLTTPIIGTATGTSLSLIGNVNSLTQSITGSSSGVITIRGQAVAGTYNFNLPITSGTSGQVLTSTGGGASAMTWTTLTTGTVTNVALTVPSFLSVAGSPITSSGTLAVSLSGTALPILNGGTGSTTATGTGSVVLQTSPTFVTPVLGTATGTSLSVTGNINSLTHTITGSTSGVITIQGQASAGTYNFNLPITSGTNGQVLTSAGGGASAMTWSNASTGTVTNIALTVPSFLSVAGSPITSSGTLAVTLSGTALPILNGGTGSTTATGTGSVVLQTSPTLVTPNIGAATGTSLSVTGQLTSTIANGTAPLVVTSTTLVTNLNANYLGNATFASPAIIGSGTPNSATFTTLTSTTSIINGSISGSITIQGQSASGTYNFNLPTTSGTSGQVLTSAGGVSSAMTWTTPTTGTVTSVALSVPSFLSISGSPIISSGTLAVTLSGIALPILNGGTGSTIATGSGSVVLQNTPTLVTPVLGVATGTSLSVTGNVNSLTHTITGSTSGVITITGQSVAGTYNFNLPTSSGTSGQVLTSGGGGTTAMTWSNVSTGTVTSVALTVPSFLSIAGSPITTSGTLAVTLSGTALPILNGGTGSTTATGSGSVVLQNTPTLTTPVLGVATGTSLLLSTNLTVNGITTINGPGTSGATSNAGLYVNPTGTVLSGSNSYFYSFFAIPQTTGSTTGSGSTLYIEGAPTNTTDPYALFIGSGFSYFGGRLSIATSIDTPAINPDAYNTLIIYDNQTQPTSPYSGVLTGSATYLQNNYIQLTTTAVTNYGQIYWRRHPGNAFSATFEIYNGTTGGNGITFYWFSTTIPGTSASYNTGITSAYSLVFEDYASGTTPGTSLWYNGVQLGSTVANISTLTNSQFNKVTVIFIRDTIRVFMNGTLIINYQDIVNRAPTNLNAFIGFYGYNVNLGNFHRIRNIRISKTNEGLLEYTSPTSADMFINATNVGIGTQSPAYPLDVSGAIKGTNLLINNIDLSGTTSGTISIKPQATTGTYNFNLPTTAGTSGQVLTSAGGSTAMTWSSVSTGTVTSVALTVPSFLSIAGSPITTSGTLAVTLSGTALPILNGGTGSTTATGSGSVVLQGSPTLTTPVLGAATGTSLSVTGNVNSRTQTITGSTSGVITIQGQAAAGTYNFNLPTTAGTSGQVLTSAGGGATAMTWTNVGVGTVTSVALTVPTFLSIAGSPITSSGTLAVTLSGTALPILNGGTGSTTATGSGSVVLQSSPTLTTPIIGVATGTSLLLTGNVNSLTQSITGSTSGVITIQGQAVAGTYNFNLPTSSGTSGQVLTSGGGVNSAMTWTTPTTGTVTSIALTVPTFLSISGSPITNSGTLAVTLSGTALPIANGGTGSTTATGSGSVVLQNTPTLTTPILGVATGTSVSVTGNVNSLTHTITGSTSGVITIQGQAVAGTYNFNLPTSSGTSGQVLTSGGGVNSAMTWTTVGGSGTVTSVALTVPSFLSISGSPITTSGTLAVTLSGTSLPILNGGTGSTTATGSGSVVLQNTPTLTTPNIGVATGTSVSVTGNVNSLTQSITGNSSGIITIQGQAAAGTYNFNLPTSSGTSGQVLTSAGGGASAMTWTTVGGGGNRTVWIISDQKTSGTNGGTFTSGVFQTRTLNTITSSQVNTAVTLSANTITITPGTYYIEANVPAHKVNIHMSQLFDSTNSIAVEFGTTEKSASSDNTATSSFIKTTITVTTTTNYTIRHRCQSTTNTNGFGLAAGFGTIEIYTLVKIEEIN